MVDRARRPRRTGAYRRRNLAWIARPRTFGCGSEAAKSGDYASQDVGQVAWDLASNAGKVADILDRVNGEEWDKQGLRSDGAEFTVESIVRYMLHDVEHHIYDARELLGLN